MPLRLPSFRKAGPRSETPFRRRTPPTPQATRLMKVSLGAGLIFIVMLGIVFVPRGLQYNDVAPPLVNLTVSGQDPFLVEVVGASRAYSLDLYQAEFDANSTGGGQHVNVALGPNLTAGPWLAGGRNIAFSDQDGNGVLSVGDDFTIYPQPGSGWAYKLLVYYSPRAASAVGFAQWGT